jgi:hypothetical protein
MQESTDESQVLNTSDGDTKMIPPTLEAPGLADDSSNFVPAVHQLW